MTYFTNLLIILFILPLTTVATLNTIEKKIISEIDRSLPEAIEFLENTLRIDSETSNKKGIKTCGLLYEKKLSALGFKTIWHPLPVKSNRADHLFAYKTGNEGKKILLIGHIDTVFEPSKNKIPIIYKDKKLYGPGSADMKGGNMVIIYALTALHNLGLLNNKTITVALHSDEESAGRPLSESRKHIVSAAKKSDIALGFEGGTIHSAVTARRGTSQWELIVNAKEAHSSIIFKPNIGHGSIFEAAQLLNKFEESLKHEAYLTINPGIIMGGGNLNRHDKYHATVSGKDNIIAKQTIVRGDLRFISEDQKYQARKKMKDIISNTSPNISAKLFFLDGYPSMYPTKGNKLLLKKLSSINESLGYGKIKEFNPGSRGAADISFVASYVDSLDGLGVDGGGAHTKYEYVNLNTLDLIIKRAAILIYQLINEN